MTDNSSQNWNFDEVSPDEEGSDRLCIDIDSLWNMIEENPGSSEVVYLMLFWCNYQF